NRWIEAVVAKLVTAPGEAAPAAASIATHVRPSATVATAYTRKNPWQAPVLANIRLTARDSTKDVRDIELSLEGAGIHYEVGDALGVVRRNHETEVAALLEHLPFDAESAVEVGGASMSLREALTDHLDIGPLNRALFERYAALSKHQVLSDLTQENAKSQLE